MVTPSRDHGTRRKLITSSAAEGLRVVEWLNSVLSRIADGTLLPAAYFRRLDCDAALDARDGDAEFAAEWVREFEEAGRRWAAATEITAETRGAAEDIRRESFLAVSRATRQHEIASYVSDDFELIVRGRLVGAAGGFLGRLWAVYDRGEFPLPPLPAGQDAEPDAAAQGEGR